MKNLIQLICLFVLSILFLNSNSFVIEGAERDTRLPECISSDDNSCIEPSMSDTDESIEVESSIADVKLSDCLEVENSCPVEFLEAILCETRGYLCHGRKGLGKFSWGKLSAIHSDVLAKFELPTRKEIAENTENEDEVSDFIDHEALEFSICTLENKKLCPNGSLYGNKNCVLPRMCSGGSNSNSRTEQR